MNFLKTSSAFAVAVIISQAAFAQDAAGVTAEEFPLAPAVEPALAEVTKATHGDWQIRCATADAVEKCVLYQLVEDSNGTPVVEVTMVKLPEGSPAIAGITAVTPLGTILNNGLVFQIDSNPARQYPFNWCTPNGCFSRFGLDAASIAQMKSGSAGAIGIASIGRPAELIRLKLSLSGFTAGFDELPFAPLEAAPAPAPAPVVESPVTGQ